VQTPLRIAIADDHALFRQGLRSLLALRAEIAVVAETDRADGLHPMLGDTPCDVLLLDLPPGTGDVAISLAQLLPNAEILVVTTPQAAAAEVAERAGAIALQTHQRLVGVVENMSWLELPSGERLEIFGAGGGATVAESLTRLTGTPVPLLGQVPLDTRVRESGDAGTPVVLESPDSPAARVLAEVAGKLAVRRESLVGKPLGLRPAG